MKYKIGDIVRVRSVESMIAEFRITSYGSIDVDGVPFIKEMYPSCGHEYIVQDYCPNFEGSYALYPVDGSAPYTGGAYVDGMLEPVSEDFGFEINPADLVKLIS